MIRRSPLVMSFALNVALNVMDVCSPLCVIAHGRGAPDYVVFEMLISGGVLGDIVLVLPLAARLSVDALIGLGRPVLVVGMLSFALIPVAVWWGQQWSSAWGRVCWRSPPPPARSNSCRTACAGGWPGR